MPIVVEAKTEDEYLTWLAAQKAAINSHSQMSGNVP